MRRRLVPLVAALLVTLAVAPPSAAAEISGPRAKAFVARLAALGPRPAGSLNERRAGWMVAARLRELGYDVVIQRFRLPDGRYSRNVVGTTPGLTRVIFGAHMDGVRGTVAANDNGSGVAAMLEVASALRAERGVLVAALGAEERHETGSSLHLGSARLMRSLSPAERDRVRLAVSLDMVGVGTTLNVRGLEASPNRSGRILLDRSRALGLRATYLRDSGVSDHAEMTRGGVPAVLLTWRWDTCWHRPCDVTTRVKPWKLRDAARVALAGARRALRR